MKKHTHYIKLCRGAESGKCPHSLDVFDNFSSSIEKIVAETGWAEYLEKITNGQVQRHRAFQITVSACPNGCSKPQIADVGLMRACVPSIVPDACTQCDICIDSCPDDAMSQGDVCPEIDPTLCMKCGHCVRVCPEDAISCSAEGWRILLGGRLGRHPRLAHEIDGIFSSDQALLTIRKAIQAYMAHPDRTKRFGHVLENIGINNFMEQID